MLSSLRTLHRRSLLFHQCSSRRALSTSIAARKTCDPLRILFCGSDDFSIASLRALNQERLSSLDTGIQRIDVVARPGKRTGRGLKMISHPPIHAAAKELNLSLHEVDTFTGWQPPPDTNLIIAVSFGLLIPERVLGLAKYGGLNVHPSLLPDLRGAAPLQHTILLKRKYTGVSVQTLHPTKFDHGQILAQTPLPGIEAGENSTVKGLEARLAPLGAELLVQTLRERLFVNPISSITHSVEDVRTALNVKKLAFAPKLTAKDREIDWGKDSNESIFLRSTALGDLHNSRHHDEASGIKEGKRIIFAEWTTKSAYQQYICHRVGETIYICVALEDFADNEWRLNFKIPAQFLRVDPDLPDGDAFKEIFTTSMTVEGKRRGMAGSAFAENLRLRNAFGKEVISKDDGRVGVKETLRGEIL